MPELQLFEYAVIRVVPRVEREEFVNVGVILYCPKQKYLDCKFTLNDERLLALYASLDLEELHLHLCTFELICTGAVEGGPIARLDIASRFRWLTATRSTVLQAGKVHPGLCKANPQQTLERLHEKLVL